MSETMMMLVIQFGIILIATNFVGNLFVKKLKQPKVLGELIAGMIIGPYLLGAIPIGSLGPIFPLIAGSTVPVSPVLYGVSTIGSIFLLFQSGLETDLPTFIKFSGKASVVGFGGVIISFILGDLITVLLNSNVTSFMDPEALFLGTVCTATSIGITARILGETKKMSTPEGVTIMAAAVLDDVISIVLLSVVVGIATLEGTGGSIEWGSIGIVAAKAIGFWAICMVLGIVLAPHFTKSMKRFESIGMIATVSFGIALVLAGLSEMAGLAMIIGAYIAGLSLSQTDVAYAIGQKTKRVGEYFIPVFFAVMGMMVNFSAMKSVLGFAFIFAIVAFAGKFFGCGIPALFVGFNKRGAARIGAGMLPRGEVTLIVAGIGLASGAIEADMFGVAVMTMLLASIASPPLLIKAFKGGDSGYSKKLKMDDEDIMSIELDFPSKYAIEFVKETVFDGFIQEGYFVSTVDGNYPTWNLRKENTIISLSTEISDEKNKLVVSCNKKDEQFVRLMIVETLADFNSFADSLSIMQSPDMMCSQLIIDMFKNSKGETKKKEVIVGIKE